MVYLEKPNNFISNFKATGVYIKVGDEILFLKRHPLKFDGNKYDLPGGKVETDEEVIEAAIRELKEETNLIIDANKLIPTKSFYVVYDNISFIYYTFRLELNEKPIIELNNEHTDYIWTKPQEALNMPLIKDEDYCLKYLFDLK